MTEDVSSVSDRVRTTHIEHEAAPVCVVCIETLPCDALLLVDELEDYRALFDVRWKADMRAIKRWQEAHPGNDLIWPDHADMVLWLMERHADG